MKFFVSSSITATKELLETLETTSRSTKLWGLAYIALLIFLLISGSIFYALMVL